MIKAITGTKDILPEDIKNWEFLESTVKDVMSSYNYKEIRTPIFEETALFIRGIGEATDIVSKEMYSFTDRSGTSITLKPEMTASVVRALIEHSLDKQHQLNKLFYIAPMFRQERPQAGRFRQFHQFGAEAIGSESPLLDAEMILSAYQILKKLGLNNLNVKINSLGIPSSREKYKLILRDYLSDKVKELSEDSRKRFDTNILRIFDSKAENDRQIMTDAPLLIDHLDEESVESFEQVKTILNSAGINYEIDPKLVRGLDYYTHTTFEIISGSVGAQSALCGGGRYDLLTEQLGGRPTPGVGYAAGMERILLACKNENSLNISESDIDLYIVRIDKDLMQQALNTAIFFRHSGLKTELDYSGRSVKAQMREANRLNARFTLIMGGEEFARGELVLKNMLSSEQFNFKTNELSSILKIVEQN